MIGTNANNKAGLTFDNICVTILYMKELNTIV